MAATSLRDRLLTRQGARAILSPVGIAAGVAVAVAAAVAGLPVWAALAVGAGVWAANAWRLLPRTPRPERIDPFTLHDPWRRFVQEALQARARFAHAVDRAPAGPLRDRLREIGERVHAGVEQCWLIAKRAETLVTARRGIDLPDIERQLAQLDAGTATDPALARVAESLRAQQAAAARLDAIIGRAQTDLRLLDARLGEAVARTLELSAHASTDRDGAGVTDLSSDVDGVVSEMESLRQALEETTATAGTGLRRLPRGDQGAGADDQDRRGPGDLPPDGAP